MKKVGIDIQATRGPQSGLGYFTQGLLEGFTRQKENLPFKIRHFAKESEDSLNTGRRLYWENVELSSRVRKEKVDLLHVPAFSPPLVKPCRTVVTVHDLIGLKFANQQNWPSRFYWGTWLPAAVRRADFMTVDSEWTKRDVIETLSVPDSKIRVIYPGLRTWQARASDESEKIRIRTKYGIRDSFFLFVGTMEPRKNLERILRAYSRIRDDLKSLGACQLVLTGAKSFAHGTYFTQMIENSGAREEDLVYTDFVSDEELRLLYSMSLALVFPSLYEGFGMPVLEAMQCSTAVITSDRTSLPEAAGDAGMLVNPEQEREIADAMLRLASDGTFREDLVKKGLRHIKRFSWERTASEFVEVYQSLL